MNDATTYKALQNRLEQIDEVMSDAPGNFFIKDLKGRYLYYNKNVEMLAGGGMLGKTDFHTPRAFVPRK